MIKIIKNFLYSKLESFLNRRQWFVIELATKITKDMPAVPYSVAVKLKNKSLLGKSGDTLWLPHDSVIFPRIICNGEWDNSIFTILENKLPKQEYVLVDIGANVGLFSRQVSNSQIKLASIHCVEPDEENFLMLEKNLAGTSQPYYLYNYAVDDSAGEKVLYEDVNNAGNYSLNKNAMVNACIEKKIKTVTVEDFFNNLNLKPDQKLIIKTDTQGMDEKIISLIPDKVWNMVACAVIEIWDIEKDPFDYQKFSEKIEMFTNRKFGDNSSVTSEEIKQFTSHNSRKYEDLILIK